MRCCQIRAKFGDIRCRKSWPDGQNRTGGNGENGEEITDLRIEISKREETERNEKPLFDNGEHLIPTDCGIIVPPSTCAYESEASL